MKIRSLLTIISSCFIVACSGNQDVTICVTDEIINANYIGNGVEWDPYDEAESWGTPLSDSEWDKLFSRLDYMRPAFVRCMINSPFRYFNAENNLYEPTRNIESLTRLLDYCENHNIDVIFGEYNPPTWDMKQDQKWVEMSVNYLNMLVNERGFNCIKHFIIFNEPDGDWASTNGDYGLWGDMLTRFYSKMMEYPGLTEKVSLAGPDVVAGYKNRNSAYDTAGWLEESVNTYDSKIGIYDIHAYPGQEQVYSGRFGVILKAYRKIIPAEKQIILGEAGYKYTQEPDSLLMAEYQRRLVGHKFTKGSDCNMLVYDYFYGIDMALLISETMNSGFSGIAAWMLDDAMHSCGDSGKPEDIKIWGMWNILGNNAFNDASQEEIRPWYYTWSLMCRYFPKGCNITKNVLDSSAKNIFTVSAITNNNKISIAVINNGTESCNIAIEMPRTLCNASMYRYCEVTGINLNEDGTMKPDSAGLNSQQLTVELKANSMILLTELE